MKLFDFYSLSEESGIKHIKTMSYLVNLRVIIGCATKVAIIQNCTTSETGKHLFCKPQKWA